MHIFLKNISEENTRDAFQIHDVTTGTRIPLIRGHVLLKKIHDTKTNFSIRISYSR